MTTDTDHAPEHTTTSAQAVRTSAPMPGIKIGPYVIQDVIGAGGSGRVYKVWDTTLRRSLALKLLPAAHTLDATHVARFKREVETLARLSHPNVVKVFGAGDYEGSPWFLMDMLDGQNLEQLSGKRGIDARRACTLMLEVARGVHYLHREGVIHRDIKPANIVLTKAGSPVLTDFGLAQTLHQRGDLTRTGTSVGTPAFMSPEQARGQKESIGVGADVWQLGATLFALMAGRPPYRGESPAEIMIQVAEGRGPDFSGVSIPKPIRAVILKAMATKAGARYESAEQFALELERWLTGEWVQARGGGRLARRIHATRRYWVPAGVAALGILITVAVMLSGGQVQEELTRRGVYSALPGATLKLNPVGEGSVIDEGGQTIVVRAKDDQTLASFWIGLESPEDAGPPGHGWGDWNASFEFDAPRPFLAGQWFEHDDASEISTSSPLTSPTHPEVVCFVGGASDAPLVGIAVRVVPTLGWLSVYFRGTPLGYATFDEVFSPGDDVRITCANRGLAINVSLTSVATQRQLVTLSIPNREFDEPSADWDDRRIGILTSGDSLGVSEVSYQQLSERHDLVEFLVSHRMYTEALDRISARLGSLGPSLTPRERSRLEYLRGLCLWKSGLGERSAALNVLANVASGNDSGFSHLAALAALEMSIEDWFRHDSDLSPSLAEFPMSALRRARGLATTEPQVFQMVALLESMTFKHASILAAEISVHSIDDPLDPKIQARVERLFDAYEFAFRLAKGEAIRSHRLSIKLLLAEFDIADRLREVCKKASTNMASAHAFYDQSILELAKRTELAETLEAWPRIVGLAYARSHSDTNPYNDPDTRAIRDNLAGYAATLISRLDRAKAPTETEGTLPTAAPVPAAHAIPVVEALIESLLDLGALAKSLPAPVKPEIAAKLSKLKQIAAQVTLGPVATARLSTLINLFEATTKEARAVPTAAIATWQAAPLSPDEIVTDPPSSAAPALSNPGGASLAVWAKMAAVVLASDTGAGERAKELADQLANETASAPSSWYHRLALEWRDIASSQPGGG